MSPSFIALVSWISKQNEKGIASLQIAVKLFQYKNEIHSAIEHLLVDELQKDKKFKLNAETILISSISIIVPFE